MHTADEMQTQLELHERKIAALEASMYGNEGLHIVGVLQQMGEIRSAIQRLELWQRDVMMWLRVGVVFVGLGGLGSWWPWLGPILRAMMGG